MPLLSSPGAEDAWRAFLSRYWPRIVAWARQCGAGRDDAEEIASQVLLKLSCRWALVSFDRAKGRFRLWMRKVVQHAAQDFLRRGRRTPGSVGRGGAGKHPLDALLDPASLTELADELDRRLSRDFQEAEAAVKRVRERIIRQETWEAYYCTAVLGNSAVETADALGLTVPAVYMAKQRVGAMLREEGRSVIR